MIQLTFMQLLPWIFTMLGVAIVFWNKTQIRIERMELRVDVLEKKNKDMEEVLGKALEKLEKNLVKGFEQIDARFVDLTKTMSRMDKEIAGKEDKKP